MPSNEQKTAVARQVKEVLSWFANVETDQIEDSDQLWTDYGLGELHRKSLAKPINHILQEIDTRSGRVAQKEAAAARTVGALVRLAQDKLP